MKMTDYMRAKRYQSIMTEFYKSAKKRAKKRCRFISCDKLTVRNVKSKIAKSKDPSDSVNYMPISR